MPVTPPYTPYFGVEVTHSSEWIKIQLGQAWDGLHGLDRFDEVVLRQETSGGPGDSSVTTYSEDGTGVANLTTNRIKWVGGMNTRTSGYTSNFYSGSAYKWYMKLKCSAYVGFSVASTSPGTNFSFAGKEIRNFTAGRYFFTSTTAWTSPDYNDFQLVPSYSEGQFIHGYGYVTTGAYYSKYWDGGTFMGALDNFYTSGSFAGSILSSMQVAAVGVLAVTESDDTVIPDGGGPIAFAAAAQDATEPELTFKLTNTGETGITVDTVNLPAGVSFAAGNAVTDGSVILNNQTLELVVKLATFPVGAFAGTITLDTDEVFNPAYTWSVSGNITEFDALSAGQANIVNPATIFTGAAESVTIECQTGSASNLEVNVPGLHAAGEWFVLKAGNKQTFSQGGRGISAISVQAVGASALANWGAAKQAPRYSS